MNVLDLFAGVGGFSLGAHQAGFSVPLAIDIDQTLTASRPENFPKSRVLHADIAKSDPVALLDSCNLKARDFSGIIAGPPCQGFSFMGTRNPNDVRNSLVLDFFRFVKAIRPAFFVMENVPGILTDPFRAVLDQGLDSLGSRYIFVGPLLVDASGYGAATRRIRVVVVGYQPEYVDSISNDDFKVPSLLNEPTVFDAIHDLQGPENAVAMDDGHYYAPYGLAPVRGKKGEYARRARQFPPVGLASEKIRKDRRTGRVFGFNPTKHSNEVIKRFSELEVGTSDSVSKCPRLAWDRPSPTLRAGTGSERGSYQSIRPIHPNQDRVITIREAARIQGFPDWFQFHHTKWHSFRMIGNSISPLVAEKILKLLKTRTSD